MFESVLGFTLGLTEYFGGTRPSEDPYFQGIHASFVGTPHAFPWCSFQGALAENR